VIGCIAGVAVRYNLVDRIVSTSANDEAEVTFLVQNVRMTSADAMVEGDVYYWKQNSMKVGTLISKEVANAVVYIVDAQNASITKNYSDIRYDVTGTLSVSGRRTDDGFMLDGTQYIGAGKEMILMSKNITVTVTILGVSEVK